MELGFLPYLASLAGADPGMVLQILPRPYSTYVALHAIAILSAGMLSLVRASRANTVARAAAGEDTARSLRACTRAVLGLAHGSSGGPHVTTALAEALGLTGAALYVSTDGGAPFVQALAHGRLDLPPLLDDEAPCAATIDAAGAGNGTDPIGAVRWLPLHAGGTQVGALALGPAERATPARNDALLTAVAAQLALALSYRTSTAEAHRLRRENSALREHQDTITPVHAAVVPPSHPFPEIIGSSEALLAALALVERVASSDAAVLITGETGTGKELIARAVHQRSARSGGPLVSVNCPAIPTQLAESELFGHERGAFTDAVAAKPGRFELADGGTLFLDEVADLPLDIQAKLLRVLQEREVQRVGSRSPRRVDVRIVAATNRDLRAAVRAGRFRDDLYYRLATVEIAVPPLRARLGDVPLLAAAFAERVAVGQQSGPGLSQRALEALAAHDWPGNIRELQNVIERAVLLCATGVITVDHLPDWAADAAPPRFGTVIRGEKRRRIEQALTQAGGNQAAAARLLGISRSNLARTMKSLGLESPRRRTRSVALQA